MEHLLRLLVVLAQVFGLIVFSLTVAVLEQPPAFPINDAALVT